jgi:hypothetical protein
MPRCDARDTRCGPEAQRSGSTALTRQKALAARDATAAEHAWREAGRLWERAADRETDAKRRVTYTANADRARKAADEPQAADSADDDSLSSPAN